MNGYRGLLTVRVYGDNGKYRAECLTQTYRVYWRTEGVYATAEQAHEIAQSFADAHNASI